MSSTVFGVEPELEYEYRNTADGKFPNTHPYKEFTVAFPSSQYMNEARNNFPQRCSHFNGFSTNNVTKFTEKFINLKDNKDFTFYK